MTSLSSNTRLDLSEALATADRLATEGKLLEAVDLLQSANRTARKAEIERRLVRLRHEAFMELDRSRPPSQWPPAVPDVLVDAASPPVIAPDELTLETLRAGILGHGCLHVRRLVSEPRVEELIEGIDRTFAGYDAHAEGAPISQTTPWYEPFTQASDTTNWLRTVGGVLSADSPRGLYELIETFEEVGLSQLIAAHFRERPVLSATKGTLRRGSPRDPKVGWHQDGAFLGEDLRAVNAWLSLSHCGRDAPGLDLVPRRLDHIVETGTEGADFSWTVAPDMVEQVCEGRSVVRPIFEPGDVLLFDQLFLHRTASDPEMTRERYAIETWFFAPSTYVPDAQTGGERISYEQGSPLVL
jgi:hypothetical protein